jgi:hypothetical protein
MQGARGTAVALALLGFAAAGSRSAEAPIDGRAAFAKLKALAGAWEGTVEGEPGEHAVEYRVTSGGNAVIESLFAGESHEMVSLYYLNGDDLVLTHYCAMGNQPHMRLDRQASSAGELRFTLDGGTGFDPAKDPHVHAGRIRLGDGGRLESEWEFFENGRHQHSGHFVLKRKASGASPAAR